VTEGKLYLHWGYSQKLHRRETIEMVARSYIRELEKLIEHCLSEGAGGYTPSDFPLAQINQGELDRAFSEIKFEG
jgi:microcystin synthetase protein McyA